MIQRDSTTALRMLLVENKRADQVMLLGMLEASFAQRWQLNIQTAQTIEEGVHEIEGGHFDLVLAANRLPDAVGLQAYRRLRECAPHVPVIVVTELEHRDVAAEAMRMGAADVLVKSEMRIRQVRHVVQRAIDRRRLHSIDRAMATATEDARVAREILFNLYPHTPLVLPGYDLAGMTYPADIVGADYFDYLVMSDDTVGLVIGDAAGHGLGPALLVTQAQACLSALAQTVTCPGDMMTRANAVLDERMPPNRFVTLLLVKLDPERGTLQFVNAGHPAGIVMDRQGNLKHRFKSNSYPLGIETMSQYEPSSEFPLEEGDMVVMVTDGVLEANSPKREQFGMEGLMNVISKCGGRSAVAIVESIYDAVIAHLDGQTQTDDVTALVLRVD